MAIDFVNLINISHIRRIAFIKGKDLAELVFHSPTTVVKNDQFEDYIFIEVKDKKAFAEQFKPIKFI